MLWAQSATKEYIRAQNILQYYVSQLFCIQVIDQQDSFKIYNISRYTNVKQNIHA